MSAKNPKIIGTAVNQFLRAKVFPVLNWPEFEAVVVYRMNAVMKQARGNINLLPAICAAAVDEQWESAIPLNSTWILYLLGGTILDDIQDQDNLKVPWMIDGLDSSVPLATATMSAINICTSYMVAEAPIVGAEIAFVLGKTAAVAAKLQRHPLVDITAVTIEQYLEKIMLTTAEVYAVGAWTGTKLVTSDVEIISRMTNFAHNWGMSRAIMADCRDISPLAEKISDIQNGVITLPLLYVIHVLAEPSISFKLIESLNNFDVEQTLHLIEQTGAVEWCLEIAKEYELQAKQELNKLPEAISSRMTMEYGVC